MNLRSGLLAIEFLARDPKVIDNVGDDAARDVGTVPGEGDETVGAERIGVVAVTPSSANQLAAKLAQSAVKLATVHDGNFRPTTQAVRTNLLRNAGGIGRPDSSRASRCALAAC